MNYFISTPAHVSSIVYYARGGYILGNATAFNTNGNDLIRNSGGNVVVVIIQYRLGVFGFLSGQKVKDGGALNAGLCKYERHRCVQTLYSLASNLVDQQFALKWVQEHVRIFYTSASFSRISHRQILNHRLANSAETPRRSLSGVNRLVQAQSSSTLWQMGVKRIHHCSEPL